MSEANQLLPSITTIKTISIIDKRNVKRSNEIIKSKTLVRVNKNNNNNSNNISSHNHVNSLISHPLLFGIDIQSLYPYYSELIDNIYKRPVVVSILIPDKLINKSTKTNENYQKRMKKP